MSAIEAPVETAFSFLEVLRQTTYQLDEMDDYAEGADVLSEDLAQAYGVTNTVERVANATWVRSLIDSDMAAVIEGYLKECPLLVRRNAFAGTVALATPGVLNGLKAEVKKQTSKSEEQSEGRFSTVHPGTFDAMIREGIVDWTIRANPDSQYEVRRCTQCGKWFEPTLKGRSRFCSDKCRKTFNNLRATDHDYSTFECKGCGEQRPMEEFAGLRFEDNEGKTSTPLRMGPYGYGRANNLCCVNCVREKHSEWRRYIAPMESLSERASA